MASSRNESRPQSVRGAELIRQLSDITTQIRLLYSRGLDIVAEMGHEQVAQRAGYSGLPGFLVELLRIPQQRATTLVTQAGQIAETVTPTGHTTHAPLPATREAMRAGLIDSEHIDAIAKTIQQLPTWASTADRELVEKTLADIAVTGSPLVVKRHGATLLARLDQDGTDPHTEDKQAEPVNSFRYKRSRDGRMKFTGEIEPEAAEQLEGLLGHLGKPQPADPRNKEQRHGDAFTDVIHRAAGTRTGGSVPRLIITMDLNTLLDGIGTATLPSGCPLSPSAARRLACDADLVPIVLNGKSVPLDVGRARRLVKPAQRDALIARDKGCAFPSCHLPARWTDAHHILEWWQGGRTDLDNTVLLCRRHHRLLHHSEWSVAIVDGLPYFTPPKWMDYHQRPLRNTLHRMTL